jgi:preprotein translocase subunit SecY
VLLATFQAYGMAVSLEAGDLVTDPGLFFRAACVITLVGGTMFLMWLGEQITARGIGNGISLIIFVGIISEIPQALAQFLSTGRSTGNWGLVVAVLAMVVVVLAFVVFMERALRKIHIQYPRRQVGMKVYDGGSSHLPIKVNPAGVIPAIFASALLLLPTTLSTFSEAGTAGPVMSYILATFGPGQPLYLLFMAAMVIFFTFFYTREVAFKTDDVADNLKNQNGFIPGIRPGKRTAEYLDYVLNRILVLGSGYLALVVLMPEILRSQLSIPFYFGGTSILIIVSVGMDTIQQVQSHLLAHQYEGLIEKSQLRGKRGAKKRTKGTARK